MTYKGYEDKEARKKYLKNYMKDYRKRQKEILERKDALSIEYEKALKTFEATVNERSVLLEKNLSIKQDARSLFQEANSIARDPELSDKQKIENIIESISCFFKKLNKMEKQKEEQKKIE